MYVIIDGEMDVIIIVILSKFSECMLHVENRTVLYFNFESHFSSAFCNKKITVKSLKRLFIHWAIKCYVVLYRGSIIINDQSKIYFDSTNRLCLLKIRYNLKDSHLALL